MKNLTQIKDFFVSRNFEVVRNLFIFELDVQNMENISQTKIRFLDGSEFVI